jgi:hypothetical protein
VKRAFLFASLAALLLFTEGARAEAHDLELVLVVGVNHSVDEGVQDLRFADDDAARYFDLFSALGAQVYLLARFDDNTRRLHSEAAESARLPRLAELDRVVAAAALRADAARKEGARVTLTFVYAGHGNVKDGAGYVALEDARLTGRELEVRVLDKIKPVQTHFIVDACNSYYLAYARGPGGKRRPLGGFSTLGALGTRPDVGVLLSTSSARESHEWERVQAGVFSHEVRSGLYGAADANHDGRVSYREIAAFVERANAAIANERFRPDVYARPPAGDPPLVDLRAGLSRRIEVGGASAGHYVLEDQLGVYLAEFHSAPTESVVVVRSAKQGRLFLGRASDGKEYVIEPELAVASTSSLELAPPHQQTRGAAHEAFTKTFELPFGENTVDAFRFPTRQKDTVADAEATDGMSGRTVVGLSLFGVGAASGAIGAWALASAHAARDLEPGASQAEAAERNSEIRTKNAVAATAFGVSAAAVATGLVLVLWPDSSSEISVAASAGGATVHGKF